jgi:hypothetical protein
MWSRQPASNRVEQALSRISGLRVIHKINLVKVRGELSVRSPVRVTWNVRVTVVPSRSMAECTVSNAHDRGAAWATAASLIKNFATSST